MLIDPNEASRRSEHRFPGIIVRHQTSRCASQEGSALILVLFCVALLTGLLVLLLMRTSSSKMISNASANFSKTELYGNGAIDQIIGDLRQEIADGSTATSVSTNAATGVVSYIYQPKVVAASAPALSGPNAYGSPNATNSAWNATFPNLVKESAFGSAFYNTSIGANSPNRAAPVSTTADSSRLSGNSVVPGTSQNGRSISMARWNEHLLLPKQSVTISGGNGSPIVLSDSGGLDTTPSPTFLAPDWILTAVDGSNPTSFVSDMADPKQTKYVTGRYAFAIYNEGGLIDANAAGTPHGYGPSYPPSLLSSTSSNNRRASQQIIWSRKGGEAFADLTVLPGIANLTSLKPQQVSDALVGWRNVATTQANAFPATTFGSVDSYFSYLLGVSDRFITASSANGISDQKFTSRQQLISFLQNIAITTGNQGDQAYLQDAMMYLTHFSRTLNQPSYYPDPNRPKVTTGGNNAAGQDNAYNPPFKTIRVLNSFTRNDGSTALVGEPLVKKRFALNRLVWITYKGPSANNMSDPAVQCSIRALGGDPANPNDPVYQFVAKGTAANIQAYFGLTWTAPQVPPQPAGSPNYWVYDLHAKTSPGTIATLSQVAAQNREPDFFELIQAAIACGSIGISCNNGSMSAYQANVWQQQKDSQVGVQALQIGANMIDQVSPVNFPTHIVFSTGDNTYSLWGVTDLPYLQDVGNIGVAVIDANPPAPGAATDALISPGVGVALAIPTLWNPHASSSTPTASGFAPIGLRITASDITLDSPSLNSNVSSLTGTLNASDTSQAPPVWLINVTEAWDAEGAVNGYDPATGMAVSAASGAANNTAIYFNYDSTLFRDPTPLLLTSGSNPAKIHLDAGNLIVAAGTQYDPTNPWNNGVPEHNGANGNNNKFVGFLQGVYPLRVQLGNPAQGPTYTVNWLFPNESPQKVGRTYSLEYQAQTNGPWIPYKQYDLYPNFDSFLAPNNCSGNGTQGQSILTTWATDGSNGQFWTNIFFDARTSRWGGFKDFFMRPFADNSNTTLETLRPDAGSGANGQGYFPGAATQNLQSVNPSLADPDGVIRRAMGGYASTDSTNGLPMATQNYASRSIILHRPFRTVGELGYVFSDTPWKNLDFCFPESGDVALLDTFCIEDDYRPDAICAGQVDLNGRQAPVFQALLAGAYRNEWNSLPSPPSTDSDLTNSEASQLAQALVNRTTSSAPGSGPLSNIADLVGRYTAGFSNGNGQPFDGFAADVGACYSATGTNSVAYPVVQRFRESAVRDLADGGQAGAWNLLVDVIVQTGKYPINATNISDFLVEGERHYWVHIALDRTTGEIIDKNIEVVNE